jgi:Amt family ammonium transporter
MGRIIWPVILALVATIILLGVGLRWAVEFSSIEARLSLALAFLFPIGLTLLAWSALPPDRSDSAAGLATLALALAVIGYFAVGFAFHFGGAAFITNDAELQGLSRFFSLVRGNESNSWGFVGLEGFFLGGDAATPTALHLLVSQLPLVIATVLIATLGFPHRAPLGALALTGFIIAAITFPVAGHWISGGGWLARLGDTLALGHGTIDFTGTASIFLLGGATVLAAALVFGRRRSPRDETALNAPWRMPPAQFPILAGLGVLLVIAGWLALGLVNPLYANTRDTLNWYLIAVNGLAGVAGGASTAQLYSWFTEGHFDPLMGARGALAGLIAVGAGAPFFPTWAALAIGAVAGLLLPLAIFVVERLFDLDDVTAATGTYLLPAFWGLLAVGIFADGRWGKVWNGAAGIPEQGVSGLIVARGIQPDGGQLAAQVWGAIALFVLGFLLPWGLFKVIALIPRPRIRRRSQALPTENGAAAYAATNPDTPPSRTRRAPQGLDRPVNADDSG